jgi:hypothetical protein
MPVEVIDIAAMDWERLRVSSRNMRTSRKLIRDGEALPGLGLYALVVKTHEGDEVFTAPRHRHNFSQIRLGLRGYMNFGPELGCAAGEVGFFPGGAYYGPEEIDGSEYLLVQWGRDWISREQDRQAIAELSKRGRFENGFYITEIDGKELSVDGKRAVWEHVYGRPEVIREPGYRSPIMMIPDNFDWLPGDGISGKMLGRFTEDDVVVEMIRWEVNDSTLRLDGDRTRLIFVTKGDVLVDGTAHGAETAIWSEYGESSELVGKSGCEAYVIGFPLPRHR